MLLLCSVRKGFALGVCHARSLALIEGFDAVVEERAETFAVNVSLACIGGACSSATCAAALNHVVGLVHGAPVLPAVAWEFGCGHSHPRQCALLPLRAVRKCFALAVFCALGFAPVERSNTFLEWVESFAVDVSRAAEGLCAHRGCGLPVS